MIIYDDRSKCQSNICKSLYLKSIRWVRGFFARLYGNLKYSVFEYVTRTCYWSFNVSIRCFFRTGFFQNCGKLSRLFLET
ncbi:uncharacterized protein OCT59_026621 [Rhizophagus irregularis]|uniref:uncharacterized protein n=1 Tax=Rhizophagus irregularis TaxID=588596 RepID=UPI003324A3FC|nr:hypothetical protein OCT59_026621 [Rhizophagus irregularis]